MSHKFIEHLEKLFIMDFRSKKSSLKARLGFAKNRQKVKCYGGAPGGSGKCQKSVTYYLNGL